MTAAINYYRAAFRRNPLSIKRELRPVDAPVLVVWGEQDSFLGPALATPPPEWAPNARVERLAEAGHWVQMDAPDRVNDLLVGFFGTPIA